METIYQDHQIEQNATQIMNYAATLMNEQGMSTRQVIDELVSNGMSHNEASGIVTAAREALSKGYAKLAGISLLWIIGGILATAMSGGVLIFWGAVVFGICNMIRGAYNYFKFSERA